MQPSGTPSDFNEALGDSIEETMITLLSREVVDALYAHLRAVYSIQRDEVPRELETFFSTLERTFGVPSTKTISRAITRTFYAKLGLTFPHNPNRTLLECVQEAKTKLQEGEIQL